jgi:toxin YoeB
MEIILLPKAERDINHWYKAGNKQILKKITLLLKTILENPYEGIGKPEALKHELTGLWSRRINNEHRLIYEIDDNSVFIHSCRGHY